jgi:hypothetical protein
LHHAGAETEEGQKEVKQQMTHSGFSVTPW